jgi:hypothetical protein
LPRSPGLTGGHRQVMLAEVDFRVQTFFLVEPR